MTPSLRKLNLTAHIIFSVGWIGAAVGFLALSIAGLTSRDAVVVRSVYLSTDLICLYSIVPLSLAALGTGLIQALGTQWGLFRYYWVLVKFLLTVLAVAVLLMHQFTAITRAARLVSGAAAGSLPRAELGGLGFVLLRASGLGILVLLVVTILSIYKPWGLTVYGWRKQQERRQQVTISPQTVEMKKISHLGSGTPNNDIPRQFKLWLVVGISALMLAGLVFMHLAGHSFHHGH